MKNFRFFVPLIILAGLLVSCGENSTATREAFPSPVANPKAGEIPFTTPGPVPNSVIKYPEDEARHNNLTEWWYYTGHVITEDNQRYGFEFVTFQGLRGDLPPGLASHFAITDPGNKVFKYDQRLSIGQKFTTGGKSGFDLKTGLGSMRGLEGNDFLQATMGDKTQLYAIDFKLTDTQGVALHGGGQFSYGPGGSSYYYSRPSMRPSGTITVAGQTKKVKEGVAWFDHQWGDFIPLGGGWDWFSTELDDGTSLMLYNLKDDKGNLIQVFGSYILPCKQECQANKPLKAVELDPATISLTPGGNWISPVTGTVYPTNWNVKIKADQAKEVPDLDLNYTPTLPDQELDTRGSTSAIYWEGDQFIKGTRDGKPITGSGYIELTGYAKTNK